MKRNLLKFAEKLGAVCMLAVGVVAAFSLDSCKKEPTEEPVAVVFPEAQTLNVQANTTATLNFAINADWTLYSDSEWATFNDGQLSVSGVAGEISLDLEISDLDQTLEETSTAYLTLAAGGEEHLIYTINRAPEGIEFSITDADGEEVTALTAGWEDYDYYTISANFVFAVSDENKPEWLETEDAVTNSESDPCTAGFKVVDDADVYKYAQSGKITFANEAGTISFEYDITFPGMDADGIEIEGAGQWNWSVNNDGTVITHDGAEAELSFTVSVFGDDYVIANADYTYPDDWIIYVDEAYDEDSNYDDEDAAWIHVASDDGKGAITLSVDATTVTRRAFVFAFPRSVYDALNDAHNGYGLNWLSDDDGDLETEYEQYVIADIEQTTASGDVRFSAYNGTTMESIEVVADCPDGYDVTAVLADYPDAHVGYIPWQVETSMMVAIKPLLSGKDESNYWAEDPAAYDANGDSCYGQSYYDIEGSSSFYSGNAYYCGVLVYLNSTPEVDWFYLVFNNPDDEGSDTWVLFFYGQGESASGSDETGILVQYVDENGVLQEVTVETTCPVTLNKTYGNYCNDDADFLEDYPTDVVGYIPFKEGVTYITTLKPLNTESTWISDYFFVRSCMDDYLYGNYTDPSDMDDYEGVGFKTGTANNTGYTASDGTKYPSADIQCISFPTGSMNSYDFYVVGYRQTSSFSIDSYDGLLFIYPADDSGNGGGNEETSSIFAVNGLSYDDLGVIETTYTGEIYDEFISGVKAEYNVAGEAYIHYEVGTDYTVGVATATQNDDWAWEPTALDYYGNYIYEQSSVYDFEAGQTANYNGATRPATALKLYSDPGCIFYFVWTDESSNNSYILFFYNDELPVEEPDSGFAFYVNDELTTNYSTSYDGIYSDLLKYTKKNYTIDDRMGYYNYTFDANTTYTIAPYPLSASSDWTWNVLDVDMTEYKDMPDYFTVKEVTDSKGRKLINIALKADPKIFFYIVFSDSEGNDYFFGFTTNNVPTFTGFKVYDPDTGNITDAGTTAPEAYAEDMEDIASDYDTDNVAYIAYEMDKTYVTTLYPYTMGGSWIFDTDYFAALDSDDCDVFKEDDDYYEVDKGYYFPYNGTSFPGVQVKVVDDNPDDDFFYFAFGEELRDYVGVVFFYPAEEESTEPVEREFNVYQGSVTYNVETEYSGPYDLTEIRDTYNPVNEGFYAYSIQNSYYVTFVDATADDTWITENYKAYAYDGSETISGVTFKTGTNSSDGTPYVQATVNTDPGQLFYIVFTDNAGSNYIFYFTTDTVPGSGPQTDGEIEVYAANYWTTQYEVKDAEDYEGDYDLIEIANDLDAATAWYLPSYEATSYWVTFADATASDTWITSNYTVYNESGTIVSSSGTGRFTVDNVLYIISNGTNNDKPYVQIGANPAESMFYIVFNDGTENYVIFFTPDSGESSGEETTWSAVPTSAATDWGESVWSGLSSEYGTDAVMDDFLYSDGYLNFLNGGGSGFKFATTSSTYRVQLAGSGSTTKCCIQFKVTTNGTISVSAAATSAGSSRTLLIYAGDTEITNEADTFSETTATTFTHSVTGISGETVISICSKSSGINIFEIKWVPDGVSDGDDNSSNDVKESGFIVDVVVDDKVSESDIASDTCPSGYEDLTSAVTSGYSNLGDVEYVSFAYSTTYPTLKISYLPLSQDNTWISNASAYTLKSKTSISTSYGDSTYMISASDSEYSQSGTYGWVEDDDYDSEADKFPGVSVFLSAQPSESFYLVFNDGSNTHILFVICDGADQEEEGGDTDEWTFQSEYDVVFAAQNGTSLADCNVTGSYSGVLAAMNSQYMTSSYISELKPKYINFLQVSSGNSYNISIEPLSASDEWANECKAYYCYNGSDFDTSYGEASIEGGGGYNTYPGVNVSINSGFGRPIYLVFTDDEDNNYVLVLWVS